MVLWLTLAGGYWKGMKMPFVASEACWRKTVELEEEVSSGAEVTDGVWVVVVECEGMGIWRMSMGMARR